MPLTNLPNLLIVDDSKQNLLILTSVLKEIQVNLIQALSGSEALEKTQGIELALAIIDVQMPEMSGHELAIKINKERSGTKVPIIFLTASFFDKKDVFTGYDSGAVDYIYKPVDNHILLSKINIFLDLFNQKQTIIQNIARRIQAEEKLKQLNEELEDRVIKRTRELSELNTAIKQIHKNYETFFNSIDDFLLVLNEDAKIIHTNTIVINRLGYTSEELIGKSVLMLHPPKRRVEAGKILGEILSGNKRTCPVPFITQSGVQIPVETRVTRGIWDDKPVIFYVTKDISKIKFSEEKFSKVFHINPSACGLTNLNDNKYIEINEAFQALLGFTKEEVIGKTVIDLGIITTEIRNAIFKKADSNGCVVNAEADLKAKNGDIKHVIISTENIKVQDKDYRFTVVHDITERKRVEKALQEKEAIFTKAQQIAHIGSWELDNATHKLKSSDETFRIFGYKPRSVKPSMHLFFRSIHPEDMEGMLKSISAAWNSRVPFSEDHRIILPNGQISYVHAQAEILFNNDGVPEKWMGTIQDVTEKKQIQKNIVKAIIQTEEKERAFFSKELHDGLAPLLSIVKLYLQCSERAKTKSARIDIIQKAEKILEEALTTAKEISNKLSPHLLANYGLDSAIKSFADQLEKTTKIKIAIQSNVNRRFDLGIESTIYRALIECITNTLKHSMANNITIILDDSDSQLNIQYRDDGIGYDFTETLYLHKGLGLNNLQHRIQTIGGKINLHSKPGHGVDYQITVYV